MSVETKSEFYCDPCEMECGNSANLAGHLAGRRHREKVDSIIASNEERLSANQSELEAVESDLSHKRAISNGYEETMESQKEEIAANESILNEQRQQVQDNAADIVKQTPELQSLIERLQRLRSERDALTRDISDLTAKKAELKKQIDDFSERIRNTAALTPELFEVVREEIIKQIYLEEQKKANDKRIAAAKEARKVLLGRGFEE